MVRKLVKAFKEPPGIDKISLLFNVNEDIPVKLRKALYGNTGNLLDSNLIDPITVQPTNASS